MKTRWRSVSTKDHSSSTRSWRAGPGSRSARATVSGQINEYCRAAAGSDGVHSVLQISCGGLFLGLDGQPGQDAIQPAGQGPVGRADEVHDGGDQQAADKQGVDQHGEPEPEAELLQDPLAPPAGTTRRPRS